MATCRTPSSLAGLTTASSAAPSDGAVAAAKHFAERRGVGVWARPDLSGWLPGASALVIAARGLRAADAARFGFTHLAGE